jgi:hypothetical protein
MKNTIIEELHQLREKRYEERKNLSFEERLERINQGAEEFKKLIERTRQERERGIETSKII